MCARHGKAQCKASEIRLNNSPGSIFVGCDLRPVSSMRCLRKQMRGIVLFLNSWERDSGPNRLKLSWERVVNATYIDSLVPCLQFPSGFHLRMSAWAGPCVPLGLPPFSADPRGHFPGQGQRSAPAMIAVGPRDLSSAAGHGSSLIRGKEVCRLKRHCDLLWTLISHCAVLMSCAEEISWDVVQLRGCKQL